MERILFEKKSPYQEIVLLGERNRVVLCLDEYFQFDSETERVYHEFLAGLPLVFSRNAGRVLIMGGGDGLAMREVLKYPVERAVLVELDPDMVALANRPPVSTLNGCSLKNPRVSVIVGDAKREILKFPRHSFDVIVADFPAASTPELAELYTPEFYETVMERLSPGGVFSTQVSEEFGFLGILRNYFEKTMGHSFSVIGMPRISQTEAFVYGSRVPFRVSRPVPGETYVLPGVIQPVSLALQAGKRVITYRPVRKKRRETTYV